MALTKNSQPVKTASIVLAAIQAGASGFAAVVRDVQDDSKTADENATAAKSRIRSAVAAYRAHAEYLAESGKSRESAACEAIAAKMVAALPKSKRRGRAPGQAVSDTDILSLAGLAGFVADESDDESDGE